MECAETIDLLSAYLDGELPDREQEEMEEHLRRCIRCAREEKALRDTVALLETLPGEPAPPEFLAAVRMRLDAEEAAPSRGRRPFSVRFKVPLQAAAAALILLIVYGVQKQLPTTKPPAPHPAAVSAAKGNAGAATAVRQTTAAASARHRVVSEGRDAATQRPAGRPAETRRSPAAREVASAAVPVKPVNRADSVIPAALTSGAGTMTDGEAQPATGGSTEGTQPVVAWRGSAVPIVVQPFPRENHDMLVGFATRTHTGGDTIEMAYFRQSPEGGAPTVHVFTARALRLQRPAPFGREVTIGISADDRPGIEDRITELALRLGGTVHLRPARTASAGPVGTLPRPEIVHVIVPTVYANVFLEELEKLGTIPPEEMPGKLDVRPGPPPDNVAYTVRIRIR